jgi:hypothetical protein
MPVTARGGAIPAMRRTLGAWALAALVALSATPNAALAGSFLDPGARWFTVQWRDGPLPVHGGYGGLRPLPDGSVLFLRRGSGANLARLRPDGRGERLTWPGEVAGLTTERAGTALVVPAGATTVDRLDLAARTRSTVADLALVGVAGRAFEFGAALAAFGDGSIAVSDHSRIWRITADREIETLPFELPVDALMPMGDGSVAVLARNRALFRMRPDGTHPTLSDHVVGIGIVPDGRLVLLRGSAARKRLTLMDTLGRATTYRSDPSGVLGDGDGARLRQTPWPRVRSITVAADGTLLMATADDRLRALVPPASPRPRIAIDPRTYATFRTGHVRYLAAVPGTVTLEVRRSGRTVDRARGSTQGGIGGLRVAPPSHGRYRLRLRLRTATAVTEARWTFDARRALPIGEATPVIVQRYEAPERGDAGFGTRIGPCRAAGRTVACRLMRFSTSEDGMSTKDVPAGWARAVLRVDGTILTRYRSPASLPNAPVITLTVPASASTGSRARLISSLSGQATLRGVVGANGVPRTVALGPLERALDGGRPWSTRLQPSRRGAATIRRWLAEGRTVTAHVFATIVRPTRWGPVTVTRAVDRPIGG